MSSVAGSKTYWERFYRWMGGKGPEQVLTPTDQWWSYRGHALEPIDWSGTVARLLIRLGFLKRNAALEGQAASWFVNYLWQWRFWRGPYYDCFKQQGLIPRFVLNWPPVEWRKDEAITDWKVTV